MGTNVSEYEYTRAQTYTYTVTHSTTHLPTPHAQSHQLN